MKRIPLMLMLALAYVCALALATCSGLHCFGATYNLSSPGSLDVAVRNLVAGDTLNIQPGTYTGFNLGQNEGLKGTKALPITIQKTPGAVGEVTITDGINTEPGISYVIFKNLSVQNTPSDGIRITESTGVQILTCTIKAAGRFGIHASHTTDILIDGCTITNTKGSGTEGHGIYVANASLRPTVRNCILANNGSEGLHMNGDRGGGGTGLVVAALVENNTIYGNYNGINCDGVQDSTFRANLVYANKNHGFTGYKIDGSGAFARNLIARNTFFNNASAQIKFANKATGNSILNNILIGGQFAMSCTTDSLVNTLDGNAVSDKFTANDGASTITLAAWRTKTGQDAHSFIATATIFVAPNALPPDLHTPSQPTVGAYAPDPSQTPPPSPDPTPAPTPAPTPDPAPTDPTIAQLQAQIAAMQTQLAAAQAQLTTSQADAVAKAATITQLQGQLDAALARIAAAQAALK